MDDAARMASFDECFEHQAWVRALAVRLCGDSAAADDLAQDAWVEVARSSSAARSSRAWLGGVVRNLSRRSRRRDEARVVREARAARDDSVPSADTLLAQAELQRRVLSAVASLDEAHRVVVLMRYFDGCDGEEIARKLGIPSSTVRNRIARAHEKLRLKLDREYGGERGAWSVLFAPTLAWKSTGVATGVGVAMKIQLTVATAALIALAVYLWPRAAADHEPSNVAAIQVAATAEPSAPNIALADARSAVDSEGHAVAAAPPAPEPALVFGDLLGLDDGARVERGKFGFVDERGLERDATLSSRNSYSIFGLVPGVYRITSWARGFVPLDEEFVLPAGQPKVRHDITVTQAIVVPVKFVERGSGAPISTSLGSWTSSLAVAATRERVTRIAGVTGRVPLSTGVGTWYPGSATRKPRTDPNAPAGVLELWETPPLYANCVLRNVVLESRVLRGDESELVFELDTAELETQLASFVARVVDATSSKPIEGARVEASSTSGSGLGATTDAAGLARKGELTPGMLRVWAEAEGFAPVLRWQAFEPGATVDLGTIELLPLARVRGHVLAPDGSGVCARLTVFALHDDGAARDINNPWARESAEDGSFSIEDVGSQHVRIVASDDDWATTALDVDATSGIADGIELRVERGTAVWIQSPHGQRSTIEAELFDGAGRPLTSLAVYPFAGSHLRLAPGRYELHTVVDDRIVRRQALEVGDERVVTEIAAP